MVSPSGRVPERAPDWFFMATEACGGGTPDLSFFLGVSGFIGIFASVSSQGGPRVSDKAGGRPPPLWMPRASFGPTLLLRGASSGP